MGLVLVVAALGSQTNTTSDSQELKDHHSVPSKAEVWGYGLLMVTVISLASVAGVVVMPIMAKTFYSKLMTGLIGLAVGSLAASSVFHLIPGAFRLGDARQEVEGGDCTEMFPHHNYLNISLTVFG